MNNPSPIPVPADAAAIAALSKKAAREANKLRNREVGHQLKMASLHRPMVTRSVPHARGR
jgi:hypothetical protein